MGQARTAQTAYEGRLKLLIADDDSRLRELLRMLLGDEFDVDVVESGKDALLKLEASSYDAILCDLSMRGDGAPEVHEALRKRDPSMAERLIVISGGAHTAHARSFLAQGWCPSVAKPFSPADVRLAVADVVRRLGRRDSARA